MTGTGDGTPSITGELRCGDCGQWFYSAAAQEIVERNERCTDCGGRLGHAEPRPLKIEFVGMVPPTGASLN